MYPASSLVIDAYAAQKRQYLRIAGTDENHRSISITQANVPIGGFNIDRYACNSERLEMGTAIASEMTLKLDNHTGAFSDIVFEGTELKVEVGIDFSSNATPVIAYTPCGYFTPDEQPRALNSITIHALDRMMLFDKKVDPSDLTFPCTVASLVSQCCTECGVTLQTNINYSYPNYALSISGLPEGSDGITYRTIIQWCAGLLGSNAYIDWDGKLRIEWFQNTTSYVTTVANRFDSDMQEADIHVSGFTYTDSENVVHISGTDSYTLDLTDNGLINASNADNVLAAIYSARTAYTYRPFTASVISAPYLWPMDVISFTDKDGNGHTTALTNVNFSLGGSMKIAAKGESQKENSYAKPGAFTARQAAAIQQLEVASTNNLNEAIDNATKLITGEDGGYVRFMYNNGELNEILIMNTPDVTTATKVWRWNNSGFGYSSSGYNGQYTTAITQDGAIVANFITVGTIDGNFVNAKQFSVVDANNNVIATLDSTLTLGNTSNAHVQIDKHAFRLIDDSGNDVINIGDARSISTNEAKVVDTIVATEGKTTFVASLNAESLIDITIDGNTVSSSDYTLSGNPYQVVFNTPLSANEVVQIIYYTSSVIVHVNTCQGTDILLNPPGNFSFNSGSLNAACGAYSHAEGNYTESLGKCSHSEGYQTEAYGDVSHAEGEQCFAYSRASHAEGYHTDTLFDTTATGAGNTGGNHAEGHSTHAGGDFGAHAEGWGAVTNAYAAHAEGCDTQALHNYSHAQGRGTKTGLDCQFVFGKYNEERNSHAEVVGWGSGNNSRDDIRRLSTGGNMWIKGSLTQNSDARLKTECGNVPDVSSIPTRAFKWNDIDQNHDDLVHIGYYAQDVENVAPYLVSTDEITGRKSLDYIGFLCAKIASLEKRLAELESHMTDSGGDIT